jgi:GxxExxY protein
MKIGYRLNTRSKAAARVGMDILVDNRVVVECKSVEALTPIHEAQLLTYLSAGGGSVTDYPNIDVLKNGIRRKIMGYDN